MLDGVQCVSRMGIFAGNVKTLILDHVTIEGQEGEKIITEHIEDLIES